MWPAAAKAAMGRMACWRAVRISDWLGAVVCVLLIPWYSCAFAAAWLSAKPTPSATASTPAWRRFMCSAGFVLFIRDFLHPGDVLAIHRAGDGQVGHRGRRRGAVPVLN